MNKQQAVLFAVAMTLIAGTAGLLTRLKASHALGKPGIRTSPVPGSRNLGIDLPEKIPGCESKLIEEDPIVTNTLPRDTSFGQRLYLAADGFQVSVNVVLMGSDRTSLHKPQFCLEGSGWKIDPAASRATTVRIEQPRPYDLPVMKLIASKAVTSDGQTVLARGVYVYWFVAENAMTAHHWQRMWWMAKNLLRTGVLQRWAYVTCFSVCPPGQEEATFNRMKQFMAAAVPEFQLTPQADATAESSEVRQGARAL